MLADEGFEEGLQEEILDPVAQDVNDQEPAEPHPLAGRRDCRRRAPAARR